MNVTIDLSLESIQAAIRKLNTAKANLRWGVSELVDSLSSNAAEVANDAYGGMANAVGYGEEETVGKVIATGAAVGFAEFGAGDTTMEVEFENNPDFPVYPGSWSYLEGSGEYFETLETTGQGYWHFGGQKYTYVWPRHGLLDAKNFIIQNSTDFARDVIRLD